MNDELKDFFQQKVNYAVVLNLNLQDIERLKHFLADEDIRVIYQKTSVAKLIIKEEKHD